MTPVELVRMPAGYLKVANPPTQEELDEYYSTKYYQTEQGLYSSSYPQEEIIYFQNKIEQKFIEIERISPSLRDSKCKLIDVGCGEGFTLDYFYQKKWEVLGLDFSHYVMKTMHPEYLPHFLEGNVYENLKRIAEKDEKFHVIWLSNMLEHVLEPELLLQLARKIALQNAVLLVQVPNDFSLLQNYLMKSGKIEQEFWIALPDHISYFDQSSLRNIGEMNGWDCASILADFPIDIFLMNDNSNYVSDRSKGKAAHRVRVEIENLLHTVSPEKVNDDYRAMASLGLGRKLTAFFTPKGND